MFTIQSIVMAQKLKGTLSFIAKVFTGAPGTMVSAEEPTLLWAPAPLPCPSGCQASQERKCMSGKPPHSCGFSSHRMTKGPPMRS